MNSGHQHVDVLLNRSRASFRKSLTSRSSWASSQASSCRPSRTSFHTHRDSLLTVEGEEVVYEKYKWSKDPSFCSKCADIPKSFIHFLRNLSNAFGWKFVVMVICVYGCQQGLGYSWSVLATSYYFKDVMDLSAASAQAYTSATMTPWSIKPIYGILSDSLLFYGLQRAPYISFAGGIGIFCFGALAAFKMPIIAAAVCIFGGNLSMSSPDVMIDAIVAQQCKFFPRFASDLQSLCWGSFAFFAMFGFGTSGVLIHFAGSRVLFGVIALTSASVLIPSCFGFVGERRLKKQLDIAVKRENDADSPNNTGNEKNRPSHFVGDGRPSTLNPILEGGNEDKSQSIKSSDICDLTTIVSSDDIPYAKREEVKKEETSHRVEISDEEREMKFISTDMTLYNNHRNIFWLGLWVSFCALALALIVLIIPIWAVRFAVLAVIALIVAYSVYKVTNIENNQLACVALFIFLRQACTPDIETSIFYWYTESEDGPQFSAIYIGILRMFGNMMMLLGVVLYSRYFTRWQYRKIYVNMQVVSMLVSLIDIAVVTRVNKRIGIPDEAMLISDTTIAPCVLRLIMMPTLVLAAKVCPDGTEATLFALLMSLANFGRNMSQYLGTALVLFFEVSDDNYDNFVWVVVSKSLLMLVPILFVPLLVPDGCPQDDDDDEDIFDDEDTTYGSISRSILGNETRKSGTSRLSHVGSSLHRRDDSEADDSIYFRNTDPTISAPTVLEET